MKLTTTLCAAALLINGGCATLVNDSHQNVAFNTEPPGATVGIDGAKMGITPCVLPVARRGGDKIVTFELDGYKTVNLELDNTLHGALAGNLLFGGFIGLAVDAVSGRGGGYQDSVSIVLEPGTGAVSLNSKDVD